MIMHNEKAGKFLPASGFCLHASREPSASRFLKKVTQKLLVVKRFKKILLLMTDLGEAAEIPFLHQISHSLSVFVLAKNKFEKGLQICFQLGILFVESR